MVMEFLDGSDLSSVIHERGVLTPSDAVDLLMQACEALAEAHALGIVHRDVKPANLFVTRRPGGAPLLKVLDFGISKAPRTLDGGLTSTNSVMGTPLYMSPEQMRSAHDVDARTDQWALGVVLYECLSGRLPFEAETFAALCLKVAMEPTPSLHVACPSGLERIVRRCLAKEPSQRFESMGALAAALAPFAGNKQQAAVLVERTAEILRTAAPVERVGKPRSGVAGGNPSPPPPTTLGASTGARSSRRESSHRGAWILGGLVASAAIAVAIVAVSRGGDSGGKNDARTKDKKPWPKAKPITKREGVHAEPLIRTIPPTTGDERTSGTAVRTSIAKPKAVKASSTHRAAAGYRFDPGNLVDGDLQTCWQPSESDATSAWVRLDFSDELTVTSVSIANGFQLHDEEFGDEFLLNSRAATGRLRFSDGEELPVQFASTTRGFTEVDVPRIQTRSVMFLVDSTYIGSKWRDLAISEIQVRKTHE